MKKKKIIRITTVPISLFSLLKGQLKFLSEFYEIIAISSAGKLQEEVSKREGIKCISVEMTRKISPFRDLLSIWELYKVFKREKPFIVHTHTPKAGIAGMIAAKLAGVPHRLHTVGGLPLIIESGVRYGILYVVEKITFSCATRIFPISKGIRDYIVQKGLSESKKLKIIFNGSSNGIDVAYFDSKHCSNEELTLLKTALDISEKDFIFLFVGRLVKDKGINELVQAFKSINSDYQNVKLLLVGPFEHELDPLDRTTINEIEHNKNIISVGFQADVRAYYGIADVFVLPSYREGFGNVIAQAGAMNLPCIVSDITGCNEIIISEVNGLIVPSQSIIGLETAMHRLMLDRNLQLNLRNNARKMIIDRYEQSQFWKEFVKEYDRCN